MKPWHIEHTVIHCLYLDESDNHAGAVNLPPSSEDHDHQQPMNIYCTHTENEEQYFHSGSSQFYPSASTVGRMWNKTRRQKWRELMEYSKQCP